MGVEEWYTEISSKNSHDDLMTRKPRSRLYAQTNNTNGKQPYTREYNTHKLDYARHNETFNTHFHAASAVRLLLTQFARLFLVVRKPMDLRFGWPVRGGF